MQDNEYKNPVEDATKLDTPQAEKMNPDWKLEPTIADIKGDLEYARAENNDQRTNVSGWLDLRNASGKESGKKSKSPGRSSVQPKLIRKHNEWRYPALSEPFLNTERMFNVEPRTFEDKESADQNQLVINYQFDTKLDKVDLIDRLVRKTVDEGTCIARVGWERKTEKVKVQVPQYDYYPITDPQQLQLLTQATQYMVSDPEGFEADTSIPDDLRASVEYSAENQIPVYAKENGFTEVIEEKIVDNHPSIRIIDVANFFVDPSCDGNWQEAQYMLHTYEATRSDLKKRGIFKNLDKVSWQENQIKSKSGDPDHETNTPIVDPRMNQDKCKVLVYEYWGLYDIHDDGAMVPIVVTFIGDTIIQMQENPFPDRKPPFVVIPYMPILGSVFGEADASLLQDNQRVTGAITRGMIDLLGRSANAQTGYAKGFLDPVNRRRFNSGEDFEYNPNSDPKVAIQQMKYPEIPQSAIQINAFQNAEAEGLSGVKSFSSGITGESYGRVARGISGALDAAGQREMSILRRLAEGVRLIGKKILAMNAIYLEEEEVVRVTNKEFVKVKRADLAGNFDLIVDISTAQVDEAKSQDLGMMLQTQGPNMEPGMQAIILAEIADLKRMPHLAERIRSYKPEPDPMQIKMQELQIALLEAQIETERSKAAENYADAEAKAQDTAMEADGTKHQRSVEAQGAQARGNRDLEVTKALLAGETPPQGVESAVGWNTMVEQADRQQAQPKPAPSFQQPQNVAPLAPLQSAPQAPVQQPLAPPQ